MKNRNGKLQGTVMRKKALWINAVYTNHKVTGSNITECLVVLRD